MLGAFKQSHNEWMDKSLRSALPAQTSSHFCRGLCFTSSFCSLQPLWPFVFSQYVMTQAQFNIQKLAVSLRSDGLIFNKLWNLSHQTENLITHSVWTLLWKFLDSNWPAVLVQIDVQIAMTDINAWNHSLKCEYLMLNFSRKGFSWQIKALANHNVFDNLCRHMSILSKTVQTRLPVSNANWT